VIIIILFLVDTNPSILQYNSSEDRNNPQPPVLGSWKQKAVDPKKEKKTKKKHGLGQPQGPFLCFLGMNPTSLH